MRPLPSGALAIGVICLGGCTQDFDQFEPDGFAVASTTQASNAASTVGVGGLGVGGGSGGASQSSAASGQGGKGVDCEVPSTCATTTQSCGDTCGAEKATCVAGCPMGSPGKKCQDGCLQAEADCRNACALDCLDCAGLPDACGSAPCKDLAAP
jgi:hypothetical protein